MKRKTPEQKIYEARGQIFKAIQRIVCNGALLRELIDEHPELLPLLQTITPEQLRQLDRLKTFTERILQRLRGETPRKEFGKVTLL